METTLFRIAILGFSAALAIAFHEPRYLFFLVLLVFTRKKAPRRDIMEEFDAVHDRLDLMIKHAPKGEDKTN